MPRHRITKSEMIIRNALIKHNYISLRAKRMKQYDCLDWLSQEYGLSIETVKKIVSYKNYPHKKKELSNDNRPKI